MNKDEITELISQKDLVSLLSNVQEALKSYTVKELNDAILTALNQKHDLKKEVDFVVKTVANAYKIQPRTLMQSRARGDVQEARMVCYAVLHLDLEITARFIAKRVFNKYHNSVNDAIKRFRDLDPDKFSKDRAVMDRYKECRKQTIEFIIKKP